jgi:hypothetical protein
MKGASAQGFLGIPGGRSGDLKKTEELTEDCCCSSFKRSTDRLDSKLTKGKKKCLLLQPFPLVANMARPTLTSVCWD